MTANAINSPDPLGAELPPLLQELIRAGRVVEKGSLSELRHLTRTIVAAELSAPAPGLSALAGVHELRVEGSRVRFAVDAEALDGALRLLSQAGVRGLVSQPPTLEDLFMRHYQTKGLRHDAARNDEIQR